MTVVLPLLDPAACRLEIERQRFALEHGWAKVPGLISACLAILPGQSGPDRAPAALLLECSFETGYADLMFVSFSALGQELSAVFRHCAEYPEAPDFLRFSDYLGARARRSTPFGSGPAQNDELALGRGVWRALDACHVRSAVATDAPTEDELEARRSAVGMQEPTPGVPLVHVAWLVPGARARVKRALRALECERSAGEHDARFLLDGARLVFVAYPNQNAQRWSERLSQEALAPCARIWRNSHGYPRSWAARRARRARRLQEFVLEHRIPVAAWFNVRAPLRGPRREI